ncbi:hypothetical protein RQP54_05220 [Curvibacter sp. APW13]|uniref:hypothetical protein n=1 Tax=Curvibacter sp. APW13 TaxID=3077236 RepID=UPI0028DD42A3|nr:hypothetical protein [Curvibacter sp. APW13]MDT8990260.1 hypothetical protein [Curvibacter sp. APW13]
MEWEPLLSGLALLLALAMKPWRLLARGELLTPLLAVLVLLPWLWAMPRMHAMPIPLQWSGACLVQLSLGWPLAIPVLCAVTALSGLWVAAPSEMLVAQAFWQGILPATLAMGWGALLRRLAPPNIFVYTLGRAFLGTVLSLFVARLLAQYAGNGLPEEADSVVAIAHWLVAWGDGFMTGLVCAIAVAYAPGWLVTWSDRRYLQRP